MGYFSDTFMECRRKQWLRSIAEVEIQANGVWRTGVINQKKIEGDTLVIMATFPIVDYTSGTITASRVIDVRGEVVAYQQHAITKIRGQGTMIKISVPIYEVKA